jgi:hypothetical protein
MVQPAFIHLTKTDAAQLSPTDAADFSLLAYGQASAACNISFTAAAGGQVTFEAANSQYAGQPARYKYSFSAADSTNCGNADVFGLSNADGSSNSNNTGVTTSAGIMLQSSAKGSNNMFVHSTNNGGPNDFSAFYYSIPAGLSNTTDTFQFYDGNVVLQTATVTIPAATPGAPTGVTATAGNAQASVAFTAPPPMVVVPFLTIPSHQVPAALLLPARPVR